MFVGFVWDISYDRAICALGSPWLGYHSYAIRCSVTATTLYSISIYFSFSFSLSLLFFCFFMRISVLASIEKYIKSGGFCYSCFDSSCFFIPVDVFFYHFLCFFTSLLLSLFFLTRSFDSFVLHSMWWLGSFD